MSLSLKKVVQPVISGSGATRTLTLSESGSRVLMDRAAGIDFTLPAPKVGLFYDFSITVTPTSNDYTVTVANTSTDSLVGTVNLMIENSATGKGFTATSSHTVVNLASAAKGWLIGGNFRLTCISTTKWSITGTLLGSGTITIPFA